MSKNYDNLKEHKDFIVGGKIIAMNNLSDNKMEFIVEKKVKEKWYLPGDWYFLTIRLEDCPVKEVGE